MDSETKVSLIVTVIGAILIGGLVYALNPNANSAYSSDDSVDDSVITTASTSIQNSNNIMHIPPSTPPNNEIQS